MTFVVGGSVKIEAGQAKAEVRAVQAEIGRLASQIVTLAQGERQAVAATTELGSALDRAEGQAQRAANANSRLSQKTQETGESMDLAAGSVGNLVSQFNDIGVMMAAGQNPLTLAIQQGTQISQVIGPLGAAGAVRALGAAFVGMLSPVNLITVAAIAAGAALVQWFSASGEEAESFEDILQKVNDSIEVLRDRSSRLSPTGIQKLIDDYGRADQSVQALIRSQVELASRAAATEVNNLMGSVAPQDDPSLFQKMFGTAAGERTREFDALRETLQLTYRETLQLAGAFNAVAAADGPDAKIEALNTLRTSILEVKNGYGGLNDEGAALIERINAAADAQAKLAEGLRAADGISVKDEATARAMLATLNEQAAIQQAINQYGADSVQVTDLRAAAERAAFSEVLSTLNISQELRDELLAAFDNAERFGALNLSAGVSAAANEAARLADNIGAALRNAAALASQGIGDVETARIENQYRSDPVGKAKALAAARFDVQASVPPGFVADQVEAEVSRQRSQVVANAGEAARLRQATADANRADAAAARGSSGARSGRSGGGRGGVSEIERQREALERLIERETTSLDIARQTDPVQREMIRHRQTLAVATDAERSKVEQLITARVRETEALKSASESAEFFGNMGYNALDQLILQGKDLDDVLGSVIKSLISAALKAAVLGEGPLAKVFGITGSIFGGLLKPKGLSIAANAEGGYFAGRGTGTSDENLSWISDGEFIVRASQTKKHRALLEAINSGGSLPGFARGGLVGGGASGASTVISTAGQRTLVIMLAPELKAQWLGEARDNSVQIVQGGLRQYDATQLPQSLSRVQDDPRRVG